MATRQSGVFLLVIVLLAVFAYPGTATAGPAAATLRAARRSFVTRLLGRDLRRDAATRMTRLGSPRTVFRYVRNDPQIRRGSVSFPPGTHFTSRAPRGRPMQALSAQRTYGLPTVPRSRLSVKVPQGTPVRFNRVIGGSPGRGELTLVRSERLGVSRNQRLR